MNIDEISVYLKKEKKNYLDIRSLSKSIGIYAIYFSGEEFYNNEILIVKNQLLYVGKTESNEKRRVLKTHFSDAKTGSSTLRKSIGSLLQNKLDLKPIPRNESDYKKRKFSHFKFDNQSEEKLTSWMKTNLALSFFEFSYGKQQLEELETKLIKALIPILNISKNNENPFLSKIKLLRKECANIARKQVEN